MSGEKCRFEVIMEEKQTREIHQVANAFLSKPVRPSKLVEFIDEVRGGTIQNG